MSYQPWMDHVRVGDVLVSHRVRPTFRVVRYVGRYDRGPRKGQLRCVEFTIKHCSWTGRCTTCVNYNDLYQRGFRPTGMRLRLRSRIDKLIDSDARLSTRNLTCCDVEGIA